MESFNYVGFVEVKDREVKVLNTQWTLTDPRFHPETHSTKESMAQAVFALSIPIQDPDGKEALPPEGFYRLTASGQIVMGSRDEEDGGAVFTADVQMNRLGYQPADPSIVRMYTVEQWGRCMYVEVDYSNQPA